MNSSTGETELKRRLCEWAQAHAGPQFQRLGYASAETLAGTVVIAIPAGPPAAEIERIVTRMEQAGRWREGRVLRTEYFMATLPESERLQRLNRIGIAMGRSAYYAYLAAARAFVLGALSHQVERIESTPEKTSPDAW